MSYLKFFKEKLVDLDYSLKKEFIRSNRAGAFCCSTIGLCNTRKYHGLLVCPINENMEEKYVLLSSLDISIIQHGAEFNLGIHKYDGNNFYPKGHKYIENFEFDTVAKTTFRVGGVVLSRRSLLTKDDKLILKYTLEDAHSPTTIRLKPFLAFRNMHSLSKANMDVNTQYDIVDNGVKMCMYKGFPSLNMQISKKNTYYHNPDWNYNVEYIEEMKRGYDYKEDLYTPGYFEIPIKKGETIYFVAGINLSNPKNLEKEYDNELKSRLSRTSYKNCLINAAQQFIIQKNEKTSIIAGYPWFGSWGRDTFIALPGLTLSIDDEKNYFAVIDTMIGNMKNGLFPNMGYEGNPAFNSVDAPLWFFWCLQQYVKKKGKHKEIWKKYSHAIVAILDSYRNGTAYNIQMHDNGLIYAGQEGKALTWMDAVVNGEGVTPRIGFDVEICALWYNAIKFSLELAEKSKDKEFVDRWSGIPKIIDSSFVDLFWSSDMGYLADVCGYDWKDWSIRPNQVLAISLDYSPLTTEMKESVLRIVRQQLLTPRGLRTLSPEDERYKGIYKGSQETRDRAYHQGTAWPWLLQFFCSAYLDIYKKTGLTLVKNIYNNFESDMTEYGIGTIAEIYEGNPPHKPRGAISQAWSVASLLRISEMIDNLDEPLKNKDK